ncbi:MAG: hypothetical protein OSA98_20510 [Rubripirellula sp.]|nr:hypothetical protein [Rubripirellula sp.]
MRQFCCNATALMVMVFAGSMAYGEGERNDPGRADRTSEKDVDPESRIWQEESGDFIHDRQYIIWGAEADDFFWKRILRIWAEESGDFIWAEEDGDF